IAFEKHSVRIFMDFGYASGDANLNSDHLNGFVLLHRNKRVGLILGRELLGNYAGDHVGQGSMVAYGNPDSFSGVIYLRPGLRLEWSPSWASGIELVLAQKASAQDGEPKNLGFEIDLGTEHAMYRNFTVGGDLGMLFPGSGLGVSDPHMPIALRLTAALKF
ncbi:MAG: hypothetical protein HY537_10420, partial [Deltaproteobacteria bacterium]|nr:hypothetical protein [Deltaproteobacteria bacterium]